MGKLDGKVAIISGAATGIGRGIAMAFAKEGAYLAICGRRLGKLQEAAFEFETTGAKVLARSVDLMDKQQIEAFVADVIQRFGRVDILVNNACTMPYQQPLHELSDETWYTPLRSGLDASFFFMRACFPYMKRDAVERSSTCRLAPAFGAYLVDSRRVASEDIEVD